MLFRENEIRMEDVNKIIISFAVWYSLCDIQNVKPQISQSEHMETGWGLASRTIEKMLQAIDLYHISLCVVDQCLDIMLAHASINQKKAKK